MVIRPCALISINLNLFFDDRRQIIFLDFIIIKTKFNWLKFKEFLKFNDLLIISASTSSSKYNCNGPPILT